MPTYRISVVNAEFSASEEHQLESLDAARKEGIKAALAIGVDEVRAGKPFFGAEVRVQQDGDTVSRAVVSVGASPLQ
jgi:hypothetical protein